jgi:hypothetical protein
MCEFWVQKSCLVCFVELMSTSTMVTHPAAMREVPGSGPCWAQFLDFFCPGITSTFKTIVWSPLLNSRALSAMVTLGDVMLEVPGSSPAPARLNFWTFWIAFLGLFLRTNCLSFTAIWTEFWQHFDTIWIEFWHHFTYVTFTVNWTGHKHDRSSAKKHNVYVTMT